MAPVAPLGRPVAVVGVAWAAWVAPLAAVAEPRVPIGSCWKSSARA